MKNYRLIFLLTCIFVLCAGFSIYLNQAIKNENLKQLQHTKEDAHQRAVKQFTSSIENFATVVASLKAFVDAYPTLPTANQLQEFTNNCLSHTEFAETIIISYIDTTFLIVYNFDRQNLNLSNLIGTNISSLIDDDEIEFLTNTMKDDKLHLGRPVNLIEGWLGIPLVFSVNKKGKSIGCFTPLISFPTIINSVYNNVDSDQYIVRFTANGIDFDRGAIYDSSSIHSSYRDPEYYRNYTTKDPFITTELNLYGYDYTISTALKESSVVTVHQNVFVNGFLILIAISIVYIGMQYKKNEKTNSFLSSSKARISKQNLELLEAKERYTSLLNSVGDGVFEVDSNSLCIYANPKMLEMLNMTSDEVINTSVWDFVYSEDVSKMKSDYGKKFRSNTKNCNYEYRIKPKNGPPIWLEQNSTMQYEGKKMIKLQSIARNITETKKMSIELDEKEKLFRLVSENSTDIIALHEIDGTYIFVSPSSYELIGYHPHELVGKSPYSFIHPDDIEKINKGPHRRTIILGERVDKFEYRIRKKNGSYIWMEAYTKPILNEHGKLESVQTSSRDITTRKIEKEQLEKAKIKAEEASIAKDHFLSMMSHEIRTPLNGIIGTAHLLLNNKPAANQLSHLNILRQSSDNLSAIVNDILDFSKIEEGKIELENAVFDLHDLVKSIHAHYHLIASEKGVKAILKLDKSVSKYYLGDSVRISQVIHNLMSNAVKFTYKGFIKIALSVSKQHDEFDEILFSVKDSGVGIALDQQEKIFEIFAQADKSTTRNFGGSGLGLAIMKRLVEIMGSEVHLNSETGKGSEFKFKLALQRENNLLEGTKKTKVSSSFTPLSGNVLIVEDNAFNMAIARDFLTHWGCKTHEDINGKKALEVLASEDIDLVLLDLQMPILDGYETIKRIRRKRKKYYKELPVVALTAAALGDIKKKVFQAGMNDFITKPFNPTDFYVKISQYLIPKKNNLIIDKNIIYHITSKLNSTLQDESSSSKYLILFIDTLTEENALLKNAIEVKSIDEIRRYTHKNKSSFRLVGLESLSEEAEEIEEMIDRMQPEQSIISRIKKHHKEIKQLLKALNHHHNEQSTKNRNSR